ncbi:hypothetical protein F0562_005643 [Nyssa sinensis]|uniref:Uncharacterized protein n=1 Tax=Nyssa sinensis TaxID=561372 RepID=A0A5J5AKV6_9ASTE|nr:hypothetical protein F0562_005643 [Nyssa sinensis]
MHQREMGHRDSVPLSYNFDVRESNPAAGGFLMQLDPWISPYSAKVRETIFQDLLDQAKRMPIGDQAPGTSTNRISNFQITGFSATTNQSRNPSSTPKTNVLSTYNTIQDMLGSSAPFGVVGQHLNNLNREYGVVPMVQFNSNRKQSQSFSFIEPDLEIQRAGKGLNLDGVLSRQVQLGLEISEPKTDQMITGSKWLNLNQTHPLKDLKSTGQPSGECSNSNSNSTSSNSDSNNKSNKSHGDHANEEHSPAVNPPIEHTEDSLYDNPPFEVNWGDDRLWTSGIQESGLWEWDDLVIADNLNVENVDNF